MKLYEQATSVFADAQQMLAIILSKKETLLVKVFMAFFHNQVNDDIEIKNGKELLEKF
jgi:5-methyltetrahydrofolate--homocysteine methyltransferase